MARLRFTDLVALAVSAAVPARAAIDIGAAGSYKSIASYRQLRQSNVFPRSDQPVAEQRLRVQADATWGVLQAQVAHETSFFYQSANDPSVPLPSDPRPGLKADWNLVETSNARLYHRFDRAFGQLTVGDVDVTVGRQVLPGGVGQIFGAVAQTPRFPFVTIDPEYRMGQDAALLTWRGAPRVELAVLARGEGQRTTSFHTRVKGTLLGYDVAGWAGRSDDKPFAGLELAGDVGDSVVRAEVVAYEVARRARFQGLVGLEKVFSAKWSGRAEVFYNGFGSRAPYVLTPYAHRFSPYRGEWYAAVGAGWEISPRWKATGLAVMNVRDPSVLFSLGVTYSWESNLDFTFGQFVSAGGSRAEFGGRYTVAAAPGLELGIPDLTYAELRVSF